MEHSLKTLFKNQKFKIVLILLIALIVRSIGIASRPIWYDEAFSILFSEKGLGQMLQGTIASTGHGSAEEHPLGYYTLLWLWMSIFGKSLPSVRLLSIIAGLGVVYLIYLITKELFNVQTAETAMILATFTPFQVHYAQEIRMYVYLTFWLLLSTYTFFRGRRSTGWNWWILFSLSSAMAQYTHNLAAFFLITLAVIPLIQKDWKNLRAVTIAGCFAVLLYSPWLIQLPSQLEKVGQGYWMEKPNITSVFNLLLVYTINTPLPKSWVMPGLTAAILIFTIGIGQTIRSRLVEHHTNGLWVIYLSFAPPLLLFIFSQWVPVYVERALLPSSAFVCIWFAWILHHTGLPRTGSGIFLALLASTFIAGIYQHITYRGFPYGPFEQIDVHLRQQMQPGDLILHSNKLSMLPAVYFDRGLPQTFIADPSGNGTDTLATATQDVLNIEAEPDIRSAVSRADRVWYIIYQRSINEFLQAGKDTHPDIEFLASEFSLESQETWDGVQILLFTKKQ